MDGIDFDQVSVRVKAHGSSRTLVLGEENAAWISFDVSDKVGPSARPDADLLVQAAVELLHSEGLVRDT